ncbi:chromo domain-containing protein cec-1-like [Planococcus citri]|uniref:chromo domain-containing protein cec-1-like n=1 Tax=Planococcus citri TaxID=170843 RepID=UPI0031F776A1
MSSNEGFYAVEKIVAQRKQKGKTQYLVKWEGYDDKDNSWVPAKDCTETLIEEFEQTNKAATPRRSKSITKKRQSKSATKRKASSTTREETDTDRTAQNSSVNLSQDESQVDETEPKQDSDKSKADEQHPPDEDTDANATAANSSVNLSRIDSEDEIVPKKSKPDETHPTDESSRTNHEEPLYVARKRVPYTTDELWSPDVSQDDLDPNDDSGSSSDCDTVDDLIAQKHPEKDLEIIGAAPLANELGLKLWVKLKKSGKTFWFDSKKFGAAWPQVYIDYLERHKKLNPAPDELSVKNLKKVSLG